MALTTDREMFLVIIVLAILLDTVMGDPRSLPHPVRIIGRCIVIFERLARRLGKGKDYELFAGTVLVVVIAGAVFFSSYALQELILSKLSGIVRLSGIAVLLYLGSSTLALKELIREGSGVVDAVSTNDIGLARQRISMIVGRDVDHLDMDGIMRATIETLSENLSDGVIAPLFYLTMGGVPCALAYKAVNTLDSMVGYKNERYRYFGRASARLDDIVNYIPARISGLLIALSSAILFRSATTARLALETMRIDGRKHSSPNSGYPEAATAGALGVKLGGPCKYRGLAIQKPFIGSGDSQDYLKASRETLRAVRMASYIGFFLASLAALLWVKL